MAKEDRNLSLATVRGERIDFWHDRLFRKNHRISMSRLRKRTQNDSPRRQPRRKRISAREWFSRGCFRAEKSNTVILFVTVIKRVFLSCFFRLPLFLCYTYRARQILQIPCRFSFNNKSHDYNFKSFTRALLTMLFNIKAVVGNNSRVLHGRSIS